MDEQDLKVLSDMRECYTSMIEEMRSGEDVDWSACVKPTEKLTKHTLKQVTKYMDNNPSNMNPGMAEAFTPKVPYFQDL